MSSETTKSKDDKEKKKLVEPKENGEQNHEVVIDDFNYHEPKELVIGKIVDDKYEILSLIGQGGIGNVYKAKHIHINKTVALKFLVPALVKDKRALERFKNEAEITCNLAHQNIVTVREFGITSDSPYLAMDFLDGRSLKEVIEKKPTLNQTKIIDWILQILNALEYAHNQGVIHRDIKPANIFFEGEAKSETIKVLDFGIAKIIEEDNNSGKGITRTGDIFGTPTYMSPEQCHGKTVNAQSDIYSLGCVMYELVTGKPPFQGESALQIFMNHVNEPVPKIENPEISNILKLVIYKCLEKDPADRYQSVTELKKDIVSISKGESVSIKSKPSPHTNKFLVAIIGCLVVVIAILAFKTSSDTWQTYKIQARDSYREGKPAESVRLYKKALKLAKNSNASVENKLDLLARLSSAYEGNGDTSNYEKICREYIALANKHKKIKLSEPFQVKLAEIEIQNKQYEQAIKDIDSLATSLENTRGKDFYGFIRLYELRGSAYFHLKKFKLAKEQYEKCIKLYNKVHMYGFEGPIGIAYFRSALMYKQEGDFYKAFKYIKLAKSTQNNVLSKKGRTSIVEKRFLECPVDSTLKELEKVIKET